jgi:serine/threonine-protein kinase RsbW
MRVSKPILLRVGRPAVKREEPCMQASARQRPVTALSSETWQRTFPGLASEVGEARRFLAGYLNGCPADDDAILCLSELAANAVVHSNSRVAGGSFTVRARKLPGRLRIEVTDDGGSWQPPEHGSEQHGRGLAIVARLSADWGIADGQGSRTAWLELNYP